MSWVMFRFLAHLLRLDHFSLAIMVMIVVFDVLMRGTFGASRQLLGKY